MSMLSGNSIKMNWLVPLALMLLSNSYVLARPASSIPELSELSLASEGENKAPWFCHGIDCPRYTIIDKKDEYELRAYDATKWASTTITGTQLQQAESMGFRRLFSYISGANEKKANIPMTAPVKNLITPGAGPFCGSNFTISFFVPFEFQEATPTPSSPDVQIVSKDPFKVYVRSFAGFAQEGTIVQEAAALAKALEDASVQYDADTYVYAGYDAPFRVVNRHNEIWFFSTFA
mmetsp:Transcript_8964/g.15360  ORF Transcript_8964/g.15360 Transcript_8964/m.15360 type:complete len:234 (+) Transcript_8964:226-927(+)